MKKPTQPKRTQRGAPCKYPWKRMKVGNYFIVKRGRIGKVSCAATLYARNHGTQYTCSTVPSGVKCKRIK